MRRSDLGKRLIKPSAKAAAAREAERKSLVTDNLTESSDESVTEQVISTSSNDSVSVLHDPDYDERLLQRVNLPPEPVEFEVVSEEKEKEPIFQTKLSLNEIEHGQKHPDDLIRIWDNLKPIIPVGAKGYSIAKNCQHRAIFSVVCCAVYEGLSTDEESMSFSELFLVVYRSYNHHLAHYAKMIYPHDRFFNMFKTSNSLPEGFEAYSNCRLATPTKKMLDNFLNTDIGRPIGKLVYNLQVQAYLGHKVWSQAKEVIMFMNKHLNTQYITPSLLPSGKSITQMYDVSMSLLSLSLVS